MLVYDNQTNPINPGTAWQVVGSADLNNDKKDDLVWRNYSTGQFATWIMDGKKVTINPLTAISPIVYQVPGWKIYGTYQKPEQKGTDQYTIQWLETATNKKAEWYMKGSTFKSGATNAENAIVNVDYVIFN